MLSDEELHFGLVRNMEAIFGSYNLGWGLNLMIRNQIRNILVPDVVNFIETFQRHY